MKATSLVVLVFLGIVAQGCRRDPPAREQAAPPAPSASVATAVPREPPPPEPQRPYNVLLIMIDSLRADMPWAGYSRDIAPWMTAFAKRATLYPRGYAFASYTAKSVVPALVGKYPSEMPRDGFFFTRWPPENEFISERAQKAGYRTLAGHAHGYFLPGMGTDQGFDDYRLLPGTFLDVKGVDNVTSEPLNALAKKMLSDPKNIDQEKGRRFFAYFHFLDPHYTYYKHAEAPDFGNKRRDLYDSEVFYSDKWVGDLVDWVLQQPWAKQTAILITADHGEGLGEHNHYRHAYEIWEALVRVPLFVYVPGAPAQRIEEPRGHIDLAPTIADLMQIRIDPPLRGKSLLPEIFGAKPEPRPVVVDLPRSDLMDRRRAVVSGDYKLLSFGDDAEWKLYDVAHDFAEERELSQQMPDKLEQMKKLYSELWGEIPNVPCVGSAVLKGAPPGRGW
jgi:arylsulfatase A-like enzyme